MQRPPLAKHRPANGLFHPHKCSFPPPLSERANTRIAKDHDPYVNVWSASDIKPDKIAELWDAIICPILLLWGKDSFATSPRADGRLDLVPTARLIEYENAGHWLHHDQRDRFIHDVKSFLSP